jgi:nitrate/TMAO reductase-like tetraheme cytochrome c subunit
MVFSLREHLKQHFYAAPPRTIKDLKAKLQASLTSVNANMLRQDLMARLQASRTSDNANMLRHVRENVMQCPNICLEIDGSHFKQLL